MSIDLKSAKEKIIQFRNDRDWEQFHNPKNLAQALSIEAAELQEIFLWKSTEESGDLSQDEIDRVKEELADIFICLTFNIKDDLVKKNLRLSGSESILKYLQRRCLKGTIFLLVNFGQGVEEEQ